jgi:hypothetical protein
MCLNASLILAITFDGEPPGDGAGVVLAAAALAPAGCEAPLV